MTEPRCSDCGGDVYHLEGCPVGAFGTWVVRLAADGPRPVDQDETRNLREAALAVIAYWDALDAVPSDDAHPTQIFADEMDRRLAKLREALHV